MNCNRKFPRYNAEIIAVLNNPQWVYSIEVISKDISLGGIFVYTSYTEEIPINTKLTITLPTGDDRYVTFDGVVVHKLKKTGLGIQFITKSKHLDILLNKIKRGSLKFPLF
jgi:PilZ domain